MDKTWWRKPEDLDGDQRKVIATPIDGNYLVVGPPGSGKTNILVLRAAYLHRAGHPNIKVISFTRTLREFIKSGLMDRPIPPPDCVSTFASWALIFLREMGSPFEASKEDLDHDEMRMERLAALEKVIKKAKPSPEYYDSILIDEVQDYLRREVLVLGRLTKRLFCAGDSRQRIYDTNEGLDAAKEVGCKEYSLRYHYRIGRKICRAADRVLPASDGELLATFSQYDEKALPSSVERVSARDSAAQFATLKEKLQNQLRAYPREWLAVICPTRRTRDEVVEYLKESELANKFQVQVEKSKDRSFSTQKPICVIVAKSSKGTEFRAVHFVRAEQCGRHFSRELSFTVVTRAKTALIIYHTGRIDAALEAALSEPRVPNIEELF
jgi:superfamily I DNA and RNA helicase